MACRLNRMMNKGAVSSIKSTIKASLGSSSTRSAPKFSIPSARSNPSLFSRFSLSRSPAELGCVQSLLPLHSAVAEARMTSRLTQSSTSLSQDIFDDS